MIHHNVILLTALMLLEFGCAGSPAPAPQHSEPAQPHAGQGATTTAPPAEGETAPDAIAAIVAAPDRDPEDVALDPQRKPAALLTFAGIKPGMRVAELMAGGGYTTELLARAVGPEGHVYGQNTPFVLERFAKAPWRGRLSKPVMDHVTRVDTELDAPLPPDVHDLDGVLLVLFYHDAVWLGTDRTAMNRAVFDALKPGGVYVIVDHSARPGDGIAQVQTLHRIEETIVREEVEAAGFVFDGSADFLRNPDDPRDWAANPSQAGDLRGQSDRFVLRFIRPASLDGPTALP